MNEKSSKGEQRYAIEKGKRISEEEIMSRPGVREYLQVHGRQWHKQINQKGNKVKVTIFVELQ